MTRRAVCPLWGRDYAKNNGRKLPLFGPEDVVIHDRCAGDTALDHPLYGGMGFSHYDSIPDRARRV